MSTKRTYDNRIYAPERPDLTSAKDCQPSESYIKRKFFAKGVASGDNSQTATTTTPPKRMFTLSEDIVNSIWTLSWKYAE